MWVMAFTWLNSRRGRKLFV
ncbi:hypothetical protein LINGRAHAP2_LOCUS10201 [Linum grandiflorum]